MDRGLKPGQANSQEILSQKIHHNKRAGGVTQLVGPEFKPQYWGEKNKNKLSLQL
jgi:hypothetical protein